MLDPRIPLGPLINKWSACQQQLKLSSPADRRKFKIVVIGAGLSGAAFSANLAGLGYTVKTYCLQDSARRSQAASAKCGIISAQSYSSDVNDGVQEFFVDTIKAGDYRSREANVYRLTEISESIIDLCVAQGVPFERDDHGCLLRQHPVASQTNGNLFAGDDTGRHILTGAYSSLMKEVKKGNAELFTRHEMMDLVVKEGVVKGVVLRDLISGKIFSQRADAVILASGGYANIFYDSTNAGTNNASAVFRSHKRGAFFAHPCFIQMHPTCVAQYAVGGLWVDYNLMSNIPGLFVIGEANFADHGANRLGSNSILQCLADGNFIAPLTVADYLARCTPGDEVIINLPVFKEAEAHATQNINRLLHINGKRHVDDFHRQLGDLLWEKCGLIRGGEKLREALEIIPQIREEFWGNVKLAGNDNHLNQSLEKAGRLADFMEFAELIVFDAINRAESCGCHVREESQNESQEGLRNDEKYSYVAAWEFNGMGKDPSLHKEPLLYENI